MDASSASYEARASRTALDGRNGTERPTKTADDKSDDQDDLSEGITQKRWRFKLPTEAWESTASMTHTECSTS